MIKNNGNGDFSITCDICGKPITHTDKYGMWCEDKCGREEAKKKNSMFSYLGQLFGVDFSEHLDAPEILPEKDKEGEI